MADVGTNKILENDKIIMWELFLTPGEECGRHTHRLAYALYVMQGSTVRVFDADGKEVATVEAHSGEFLPFRTDGGEFVSGSGPTEIRIPATHSVQNIGESQYKELLIEFKQ